MRKHLLLALVLTGSGICHAALSFADYHTAGDHLLVHDPTTNLDWLRLSQTLGLSPNTALSNNPGFHLASPLEVQQLLSDAGGYTALDNQIRNTNPDLLTGTTMYNMFGATTVYNFGPDTYDAQTWVHVSRPGSSPAVYDMFQLDLRHGSLGFPGAAAQFSTLGNCYACSSSIEANFLVQNSNVPEPATAGLIGVGLIVLGRISRTLGRGDRERERT